MKIRPMCFKNSSVFFIFLIIFKPEGDCLRLIKSYPKEDIAYGKAQIFAR